TTLDIQPNNLIVRNQLIKLRPVKPAVKRSPTDETKPTYRLRFRQTAARDNPTVLLHAHLKNNAVTVPSLKCPSWRPLLCPSSRYRNRATARLRPEIAGPWERLARDVPPFSPFAATPPDRSNCARPKYIAAPGDLAARR